MNYLDKMFVVMAVNSVMKKDGLSIDDITKLNGVKKHVKNDISHTVKDYELINTLEKKR